MSKSSSISILSRDIVMIKRNCKFNVVIYGQDHLGGSLTAWNKELLYFIISNLVIQCLFTMFIFILIKIFKKTNYNISILTLKMHQGKKLINKTNLNKIKTMILNVVGIQLHLLQMHIQLPQIHFLKRLFFSPLNYLTTLVENLLTIKWVYLWTLSYLSIFMLVSQFRLLQLFSEF